MQTEIKEPRATTYDNLKDSGSHWMGEIPSHWQLLPGFIVVTEQCTKNVGMIENTVLSLSYGSIIIKEVDKLTGLVPESFETYQIVNPNDIIIRTMDLQNDKTSLRIGISNYRGIISSAYMNLRVRQGYNAKYIFYFLHTVDITKVIYGLGSGLRQNLSFLDLKRFLFLVPPTAEQTAIARFLDRKTAQIDKAIAQKEKLIELLKERRQILIHNAVTKGLNPNVKMKDSGVEWIGEIPEHWESKKLKYLGRIVNGYAFSSNEFVNEGVRVMKISNIQTMELDWTDESYISEKYYEKLPGFRVNKDDLVFALTRPIISTGIKASLVENQEKILLNQRNAVLKPAQGIYTKWLYYIILDSLFTQSFDREIDKTGQQPNISSRNIGELRIPYATIDEQKEIIVLLEGMLSKVHHSIALHDKAIDRLKEYKSVLVNSVVTGKIKVPDLETMD